MTLVLAGRFFNSFDAGLAKARLDAEDIPSVLFDIQMNWEGMGGVIPVRLMVHEDDLDAARRILGED